MKFDHLGPIVVNTDGTMARIANWDKMIPREQESAYRIIAARNKQRLEALKKKTEDAEEDLGSNTQLPTEDAKKEL